MFFPKKTFLYSKKIQKNYKKSRAHARAPPPCANQSNLLNAHKPYLGSTFSTNFGSINFNTPAYHQNQSNYPRRVTMTERSEISNKTLTEQDEQQATNMPHLFNHFSLPRNYNAAHHVTHHTHGGTSMTPSSINSMQSSSQEDTHACLDLSPTEDIKTQSNSNSNSGSNSLTHGNPNHSRSTSTETHEPITVSQSDTVNDLLSMNMNINHAYNTATMTSNSSTQNSHSNYPNYIYNSLTLPRGASCGQFLREMREMSMNTLNTVTTGVYTYSDQNLANLEVDHDYDNTPLPKEDEKEKEYRPNLSPLKESSVDLASPAPKPLKLLPPPKSRDEMIERRNQKTSKKQKTSKNGTGTTLLS